MSDSQLVFYDIPSKGNKGCWSPNAWKIRMALNYKNLPYRTEWLELPEIAPTISATGIPPNATGNPYTIPAIRGLPDSSPVVQDSVVLAPLLDKLYPDTPSLHFSPETTARATALVGAVFAALGPLTLPSIPDALLNPPSAAYFVSKHEARLGFPLAALRGSPAAEKAWEKAEAGLGELSAFLAEAEGGPFVLGARASFADFVLVGAMETLRRCDQALFEGVVRGHPELKALHEACREWLKKDD